MLFSRAAVLFLHLAVFLRVATGQFSSSWGTNVDGTITASSTAATCPFTPCPSLIPPPPFDYTFRVTGVGSHLIAMVWDNDIVFGSSGNECTQVENSLSSGESFKAKSRGILNSELASLDNSNAATCGDVSVALSRIFELQENEVGTVVFRVSLQQPASGFYVEQSDINSPTTRIFYSSGLNIDAVTPAPTQAPSRVPTNTPSQAPTNTPTSAPSLNPSKSPTPMPTPQLVTVDVKKPKKGKGKGCLNIKARGKVSVYIVGSNTFDVSKIDLQTLRLNGLTVAVRRNGTRMCAISKSGAGMTCEFEMNANKWTPITSSNGLVELRLSGQLKSGIEFEGYDTVCLAKR